MPRRSPYSIVLSPDEEQELARRAKNIRYRILCGI